MEETTTNLQNFSLHSQHTTTTQPNNDNDNSNDNDDDNLEDDLVGPIPEHTVMKIHTVDSHGAVVRKSQNLTPPEQGTGKLRITSIDLTPRAGNARMTRLGSNVLNFYKFPQTTEENTPILGRGNFSVVHKATHVVTNREVAIKVVSKDKVMNKQRLIDEVRMLKDLTERPHIIQLYDVFEDDGNLYLVMQCANGGELFDRLVHKGRYSEKESRDLMKNLLRGVHDLHSRGIIHRDLKPENILIATKENDAEILISDFGLSKYFKESSAAPQSVVVPQGRSRAFSCCGTDMYMAPEVMTGGGYSFAADLWSVGVIMYCILGGYPPFYHERDELIRRFVLTATYHFYPEEWDSISNEAKEVIRALLVINPDNRPTAEETLEMNWFKMTS